ncbi:hypothetical protein M409DRAFT_23593 [Zasmidium cellare ATCC 36951]|uniref:Fungal lipase-type domain-containing protein n=1 Tax=Zasmidium cellare ATCC 36951 TaxID=1080233 RepID=A0A6A6CFL7_ZASCE|nr:uncharacterized protein M409DRAFT_23593 [Zasmidium cellare ATCC 36951]KAF2165861.1 hypothetical protein M409DRAFT_23593 [Zasmidium cellare ATCC 36951]
MLLTSRLSLGLALSPVASVFAQTAVSSSVFDNIIHYTSYAGAAYAETCPTLPFGSTLISTLNYTSTDTKAVLFHEPSSNQVVLSFRGSAFPRNLDQDFLFTLTPLTIPGTSCSSCAVHQGFQNIYSAMANDVSTAVSNALASYAGSSLIVTGHSLGGGLAALAAASLAGQGHQLTAYTYGEPRNGNPAFTTYINSQVPNYYRVTHYNDGVPQIPPPLLGFQHHGTEYFQSLQNGNTASSTLKCAGTDPTNCNAAQDFGKDPINGAHIAYSNFVVAGVLFNPACGYTAP